MKGGFYGLKAKEFSLILIALVGTTFVLWTWEKTTPLLSAVLPPQSRSLQLPPVISISERQIYVSKDISALEENETVNDQEEQHFDVVTSVVPAKSSSQISNTDRYLDTSSAERQEIPISVTEEEAKSKQIPETESTGSVEIPTSLTVVEKNNKKMSGEKNSEQEEETGTLVTPTASAYTNTSVREKNYGAHSKNEACNYTKGKWVVDNRLPLYSGSGCKQWLAGMWACRLMQRMDFAYENLRWRPKNCQLEEFEGSKFLRRMQNKTLAFVGDSLGRQQFQSLMCMITGGKNRRDVIDVGRDFGLIKADGSVRPNGWAFKFPSTNTTVLYYWSASLCDLEPLDITKPNTEVAMHLDRPPAFLRQYLHKIDVLVLNTGHHWNRGKLNANRWVMHVGGVPNTDRKIAQIGGAKNLTIHSIVKWVNSQLPKYPGLKAFFRTISPRHFVNGDWNTGGSCDNTTPMSIGKEILQDESSDPTAESAVRGTNVKLLDITGLSQLRDEGHISRFSLTASPGVQDCLHWCLPGVPDTWNEILFAQI